MDKTGKIFSLILLVLLLPIASLASQAGEEADSAIAEESMEEDSRKGELHFFLDNRMLFAISVPDGGFGFGGTANVQYTLPFNLSFGLEAGYYGFRSAIDLNGAYVVGGFTLLPVYAVAAYNFRILENFYIAPVLKAGGAYSNARINGWYGGDSFSMVFEGGVRIKAYMMGGLLVQGGIMYTGLIEKSGLFSIMSLGIGFGL